MNPQLALESAAPNLLVNLRVGLQDQNFSVLNLKLITAFTVQKGKDSIAAAQSMPVALLLGLGPFVFDTSSLLKPVIFHSFPTQRRGAADAAALASQLFPVEGSAV